MGKKIEFLIQGSAKSPYTTRFYEGGRYGIEAHCSCQPWRKMMLCKHIFAVLEGNISNIIDSKRRTADLLAVQSWFRESSLYSIYVNHLAEDHLDADLKKLHSFGINSHKQKRSH